MDADHSYMDVDYDVPICLVIGNEGFGMSRIVKKAVIIQFLFQW